MTTNVFDKRAGILATDSRWSFHLTSIGAVIYVDDAPFEKIVVDEPLAYMFAGDSARICEWKQWIASPNKVVLNKPKLEGKGLSLCLIDMARQEVVFDRNQAIVHDEARFAGTGAYPAHGCWTVNRDARKAVESAKLADRFSGGTVKFLELATGNHNLLAPDDFNAIRTDVQTRGMVMYFQNPPHVPLKDAAAQDPRIAEVAKKIARGDLPLDAPSPAAENEWTDDDRARLEDVLQRYYPAR